MLSKLSGKTYKFKTAKPQFVIAVKFVLSLVVDKFKTLMRSSELLKFKHIILSK